MVTPPLLQSDMQIVLGSLGMGRWLLLGKTVRVTVATLLAFRVRESTAVVTVRMLHPRLTHQLHPDSLAKRVGQPVAERIQSGHVGGRANALPLKPRLCDAADQKCLLLTCGCSQTAFV